MICKYCGAELPDSAVFCGQCGKEQPKAPESADPSAVGNRDYVAPLEESGKLTCPVCGAAGQPKNRTRCWQCGIPFAAGVSVRKTEPGNPAEAIPQADNPYYLAEVAQTKYTIKKDAVQSTKNKLLSIKISQYGYIGMAIMLCALPMIYLIREYTLKQLLDKTPVYFVGFIVAFAAFIGAFVWKTTQRVKYTKRLSNLNSSYLIVAKDYVEGNSLTSLTDDTPAHFFVPIGIIKSATRDIDDNVTIETTDLRKYCCPYLSSAGEATERINALRLQMKEGSGR